MIRGNIDHPGIITRGWAIDTRQPLCRCILDVYVDGCKSFSYVVGNIIRPDVIDSFQDDIQKNCGFELDMSNVITGYNTRVEFFFSGTDELVPGGSFTVSPKKNEILVFEGSDGYLFFEEDRNSTLKYLSGELLVDRTHLMQLSANYTCVYNLANKAGSSFDFLIIPDRAAVVPKRVATDFELSELRPARQLVELSQRYFGIRPLYPIEELNLSVYDVCHRSDSHLNERGLFEVFLALTNTIAEKYNSGSISWRKIKFYGDLDGKSLGKNINNEADQAIINGLSLAYDSKVSRSTSKLTGNCKILFNIDIEDGICIIFGTSSAGGLSKFLTLKYRMVIHIIGYNIDVDFINVIKPDKVILAISEKMIWSTKCEIIPLERSVSYGARNTVNLVMRNNQTDSFIEDSTLTIERTSS